MWAAFSELPIGRDEDAVLGGESIGDRHLHGHAVPEPETTMTRYPSSPVHEPCPGTSDPGLRLNMTESMVQIGHHGPELSSPRSHGGCGHRLQGARVHANRAGDEEAVPHNGSARTRLDRFGGQMLTHGRTT